MPIDHFTKVLFNLNHFSNTEEEIVVFFVVKRFVFYLFSSSFLLHKSASHLYREPPIKIVNF